MPFSVTIFLDDNTPMTEGVVMQLLSAGAPVASSPVGADGIVTFASVDPTTLTSPAICVDPIQPNPPPAAHKDNS